MRAESLEALWNEDKGLCTRLLEAFRDSIPEDKKQQRAGKVLVYLVEDALASLDKDGYWELNTPESVKQGAVPNAEKPGSGFMSDLKRSVDTLLAQINDSVIRKSLELGSRRMIAYKKFEVKKSEKEKLTYYGFEVLEMANVLPGTSSVVQTIAETCPQENYHDANSKSVLVYRPDLTLQLSRLGVALLGKEGRLLSGLNRLFIISAALLPMIFALSIVWLTGGYLLSASRPVSPADLALLAISAASVYGVLFFIRIFVTLGEDRIVIAPDWVLAEVESGATIELVGHRQYGDVPVLKALRYTANCPICNGMLKLASGEPDFKRRLVGRCTNSPREHVYSFDRETKRGKALITPY